MRTSASSAEPKGRAPGRRPGAYVLHILLRDEVAIRLSGRVLKARLAPGRYAYFGSARSGIAERIAHHRAVALGRRPGRHWHVDRLLASPSATITKAVANPDGDECDLCQSWKRRKGVTVAVKGFGATDCRKGCGSHLLRLS